MASQSETKKKRWWNAGSTRVQTEAPAKDQDAVAEPKAARNGSLGAGSSDHRPSSNRVPNDDAVKRKKLYIHIGMHKTGSTSIQYFLHANVDVLNRRSFYVPSTGRHPRAFVQHGLLANAFMGEHAAELSYGLSNRADREILCTALLHELSHSTAERFILSSEMFWSLEADGVAALGEVFHAFDIIPIVFVRNILDYVDATYQTMLTHGSKNFTIAASGLLDPDAYFNVAHILSAWRKIACDGQIHVFNYDQISSRNVVTPFCNLLGIRDEAGDKINHAHLRLNESLPPALVNLKRDLVAHNVPENVALDLVRRFARLPNVRRETYLDKDTRQMLAKYYLNQVALIKQMDGVLSFDVDDEAMGARLEADVPQVQHWVDSLFTLCASMEAALDNASVRS